MSDLLEVIAVIAAVLGLILAVPVIALIAGWRAYVRLRNRMDGLSAEVGRLQERLTRLEQADDRSGKQERPRMQEREVAVEAAEPKQPVGPFAGDSKEPEEMWKEKSEPKPRENGLQPEPVASGTPAAAEPNRGEETGKPPRRDWEMQIGGNWLNRIGALALVLGMLFFIKYAFDHEWIGETTRVVLGALAGAGLIAGGTRSHRKGMPVFGQGLTGAGLGVLYVSAFASFNFYHLVPLEAAFVLMSLVTVLAFALSVRCRALSVSLLGLAGGLLTPFLLSTGSGSTAGLFGYLAFVSFMVLLVLRRESGWTILYMLTMVAVYLIYALWILSEPNAPERLLRSGFLALFAGMFFSMELGLALQRGKWPQAVTAAGGVQSLFLLTGWVITLEPGHRLLGEVLFLSAFAYLVPLLMRGKFPGLAGLPVREVRRLGLTFLVFAVVACAAEWEGYHVAEAWTALSLAVVWTGKRFRSRWAVISGAAVSALALALMLVLSTETQWLQNAVPFANKRWLAGLVWTAGAVISACWFKRGKEKWERIWFSAFYAAGAILFWLALTAELGLWLDNLRRQPSPGLRQAFDEHFLLVPLGAWMLFSLLVAWIGRRERLRSMLIFSWILLGLSALGMAAWGAAYDPVDGYVPVYNLRFAGMVLTAAFIWIHLRWWKRLDEPLRWRGLPLTLILSLAGLFFELITSETSDAFVSFGIAPGLPIHRLGIYLGWFAYSLIVVWAGERFRQKVLMYIGLAVLALGVTGTVLDGLAYDAASSGAAPVFNLRVLTMVAAVSAATFLRTRPGRAEAALRFEFLPAAFTLTAAILLFELVTVETGDWFNRLIHEADQADKALIGRLLNLKQMSLSIVWLLYSLGLMVAGILRKNRLLRLTAMGLFGVVILKIFLFDLSFLGLLYRIFSFIGLGIILLAVSYLYQKNKSRFDQSG